MVAILVRVSTVVCIGLGLCVGFIMCFSARIRVTRETSHNAIGPCLQLLPSDEALMQASTAALSSALSFGLKTTQQGRGYGL